MTLPPAKPFLFFFIVFAVLLCKKKMLSPAEFYKDREQRVVLVWVATAVAG